MENIRRATAADASRIAEILVFSKRANYRKIFHDDAVSFGVIQVLPTALELLEKPDLLNSYWVYEDEFVRGIAHIEGENLCELYVDPFFEGMGIGGKLIEFACEEMGCRYLWVLEKNDRAIAFYHRHRFEFTGERRLQEPTPEYVKRMERK